MASDATMNESILKRNGSAGHRVARIVKRLLVVCFVVIVLHLLGIVGFHCVRRVENEPFINPVEVSEVDSDRITLKDGRVFVPYGSISDHTKVAISEAEMQLDLEMDETNLVTIYGRHDIFVCGIGMPLIVLPIIPRYIPKYNRTMLEIGELEGLSRTTELKGCAEEERCGAEPHG